jgi:hypothetical protein
MDDSEKLAKIIETIKSKTYEETAQIILDLAKNVENLLENNKKASELARDLLDDWTVTEPTELQRAHWSDQALEQLFNDLLKRTERCMTHTKKLTSVLNKVQRERKRRRDHVEAVRAKRGSDE